MIKKNEGHQLYRQKGNSNINMNIMKAAVFKFPLRKQSNIRKEYSFESSIDLLSQISYRDKVFYIDLVHVTQPFV